MEKKEKKEKEANLVENPGKKRKTDASAEKDAGPEDGAEVEKGQQTGGWQELVLPKIKSVPAAEDKWNKLTAAKIKSNPAVEEEWGKPTDDRLDPEELAEYLYLYCGGSKENLAARLRRARNFRENFMSAVAEIRRSADATERILKGLREICGITIFHPDYDFDRLPSMERAFADEVEPLGKVVNEVLARGVREEKDGRITSAGLTEKLCWLVNLVEQVTNEPYADIAPLVAAVRGEVLDSYEYLADSLRSERNRYCPKEENTGIDPKTPTGKPSKLKPGR